MTTIIRKLQLPGTTIKPAVQKRDSRNSCGFISPKMIPMYFRVLSWIFSQDKQTSLRFSRKVLHIWSKNGSVHLTKYLKESYLIVQKFVSGTYVNSTNEFPLALVGGLPRIIPGPFRSEIRKGDPVVIRMVLSSLAVFRIIKCPGHLKLETITDPFKGVSETLPDYEVSQALRSLFGGPKSILDLKKPKHLFLSTAGPNSSVSWRGLWLDIKAWQQSGLLDHLGVFLRTFRYETTDFAQTLRDEITNAHILKYMGDKELVLGRLSEKEEAAGKIRVFAITDSITQSLLAPLHDFLFGLLRQLPEDGTFDQGRPLENLMIRKGKGEFGSSSFWSYDLSAATDRLPIALQAQILDLLFGELGVGSAWRNLLCTRTWSGLKYAVGQPMGALSSWAMLALTHHVIVSIAARRVGKVKFSDYAILGDDIVIANDSVANAYYAMVTETLGVDINMSKSLVSNTHCEFAKRLVSVDSELTPLGPANILLYFKTPYGIISILRDFIYKGSIMDDSLWLEKSATLPIYGKKLASKIEWAIRGPFGLVPTDVGLPSKNRLSNSLTPVDVDILLTSIDQVIFDEDYRQWELSLKTFNRVIHDYEVVSETPTHLVTAPMEERPDLLKLPLIEPGVPWLITDSRLFHLLRETLLSREQSLLESKPVRRFIYDGPIVHFNHYRADWFKAVMSYITTKIHNWECITPAMDPFKDVLASPSRDVANRGIKFFRKVHTERELRRLSIIRRF